MKRAKTSLLLSLILTTGLGTIAIAARDGVERSRGMDAFSRASVQAWGGVILQGTTEFRDNSGRIVSLRSLKLQLDTQPDKSEQICIVYQKTCYEIGISSQNAIPLATWVFSGQTGAFTAWSPYGSAEEEAQGPLRRVFGGKPPLGGFVPAELVQGAIPQILRFIDYAIALEPFDDSQIRQKYNQRLGFNFDPNSHQLENRSYLMTDTDTKYEARLIDKQVQLTGLIYRYYWKLFEGVEYPYIRQVNQACIPASIKATDNKDCSKVGTLSPQQVESLYQKQKEALLFVQTTAVFRTFADDNCEELSRFVKENNPSSNFPDDQCKKLKKWAEEARSN